MRTTILRLAILRLAILLTLASCSGDPATSGAADATADALAGGDATASVDTTTVDAGAELHQAETSPGGSGGAAGARDGGSGSGSGSGGTGGAPTTGAGGAGGSDAGGAGGAGGASGPALCMPPAGSTIQSQYCTAAGPTGTLALMKGGRYCLRDCVAVRPGGLPAGAFGRPECVTPAGGLCVGDCGTCSLPGE